MREQYEENKGYKNMQKTGVEHEWFSNTWIYAYIAWFWQMHLRHLVGTHDCHLSFMQAWHLVIMRYPLWGGNLYIS